MDRANKTRTPLIIKPNMGGSRFQSQSPSGRQAVLKTINDNLSRLSFLFSLICMGDRSNISTNYYG
jgi:hypothetical protein